MKNLLSRLLVSSLLLSTPTTAALAQSVSSCGGDHWCIVVPSGELRLGTQGAQDIDLIANQGGGTPVGWTIDGTTGNLTAVGGAGFADLVVTGQGLFAAGSAATPSISFDSDPDTGIYRFGTDQLAFSAGGVAGAYVYETGGAAQLNLNNGTSAFPGLGFASDSNTGIYRKAADSIGFATGGAESLEISGSQLQGSSASAAAPTYSFDSDPDTGIYRSGTGAIDFSSNAANVGTFSSTGLRVNVAGSAAVPSLRVESANTGFYEPSANTIGVSIAASNVATFDSGGASIATAIRNTTAGGGLILRSPDGSYSVCTVDNADAFSCTAE